jgi:hypothetical protein
MGKFRKTEIIEIDGFALRKYGTLKKREEEWIEQFYADLRNATTKPALELAEWISENESKSPADAMAFIEGLDKLTSAEQLAVMMNYKKHIPNIIDELQGSEGRQKNVSKLIATWVLNERLPDGWIAENRDELREDLGIDAIGSEWLQEWTDELGQDTIDSIYSFILKERNGWLSVAAEFAPTVEDDEELTLGEDLRKSETGDPPTGENDGQRSPLPESAILSSSGTDGMTALAI